MSSFETTKWSVVLAARERSDPAGREALAELCRSYWYPLYAFTRRRTGSTEQARDLTQSFFVDLLERNPLERVDPAAGRFRSFLLASLKNFLSHEREKSAARKRGGGRIPLSLDTAEAESRYFVEPQDHRTPDRVFEHHWARTVLRQVTDRLEAEFNEAGKEREYRELSVFLTGSGEGKPYRLVAQELGTTEAAVKMGVRRLRRRFGAVLREEIAQTVSEPDEVDRELRHLLAIVQEA